MVYNANCMLPVDIETPSWRRFQFNQEVNDVGLNCITYLIDEVKNVTNI